MTRDFSPPPLDARLIVGDIAANYVRTEPLPPQPLTITTSTAGLLKGWSAEIAAAQYIPGVKNRDSALPEDPAEREEIPLCTGVIDYFTAALIEVAKCSKIGNEQHNPSQEMHWARGKSTDHANKLLRHLADRGKKDKDGQRHSAKVAWRALALLQTEMEAEGAPLSRASR